MVGLNKPNKIITHHFGGTDDFPLADSSKFTAQDVDRWHKRRWPGFTSEIFKNDKGRYYHCGYHFIIEKDGKVVQCRGMNEEAAAVIGQNKSAIMVAFAGNFDLTIPTAKQRASFKRLYKKINKEYPIILSTDIHPHRLYAVKTCHGRDLSNTYFQKIVIQSPVDDRVIRGLQIQLVQILTQLVSLLRKKRFSTREI